MYGTASVYEGRSHVEYIGNAGWVDDAAGTGELVVSYPLETGTGG